MSRKPKGNRFTSTLQLAIAALIVAGLAAYARGITTLFWVFIGLFGFFLAVAIVELSVIRSTQRKFVKREDTVNNTAVDERHREKKSRATSSTLAAAGFELVSEDGDEWHEGTITTDIGNYSIRLRPEIEIAEKSLKAISPLIANPKLLLEQVDELIKAQTTPQPALETAKVLHIEFFSKDNPGSGEVYMEAPTGESWACIYANGNVSNVDVAD